MSITPPNSEPEPPHRATSGPRRLVKGLAVFVAGLLVVAGAVVFILVSLVESNPIALLPGLLLALVGVAINVAGLTLIYRSISTSIPEDQGGSGETP